MKKQIYLSLCILILFTSCGSKKLLTSGSTPVQTRSQAAGAMKSFTVTSQDSKLARGYSGIRRVKSYEVCHSDLPTSFDGIRIAFISDLHYKSKFKEKGLKALVKLLKELHPDLLLMGGDYQEGCEYVAELFAALSTVKARLGSIGVMGNNDYERCRTEIIREMTRYGMRLLEHQCDTLSLDKEQIIIAGVRNPFDLKQNSTSPTLNLHPDDFVIMLTHTPDYAEDVNIENTDLVLAGHTHGGQVTLFGLYAPIVSSHYGQRFLKGLQQNSAGDPLIITNGLGTSNRNIRLFAPSEVVMITLRRK